MELFGDGDGALLWVSTAADGSGAGELADGLGADEAGPVAGAGEGELEDGDGDVVFDEGEGDGDGEDEGDGEGEGEDEGEGEGDGEEEGDVVELEVGDGAVAGVGDWAETKEATARKMKARVTSWRAINLERGEVEGKAVLSLKMIFRENTAPWNCQGSYRIL